MWTPRSRLWELKNESRCLETRRHLHLPNPHSGLEAVRGEGRKGSAAQIALITPEIAAQKLQTQKEEKSLPSLAPVLSRWQAHIYLPGSDEQTNAEHSSHQLGLLGRGQVSHFILQVYLLMAYPVPRRL